MCWTVSSSFADIVNRAHAEGDQRLRLAPYPVNGAPSVGLSMQLGRLFHARQLDDLMRVHPEELVILETMRIEISVPA